MSRQPSVLLHGCCAPCTTHPVRMLSESYRVTVFFYNPNIQPEEEHRARLNEMIALSEKWQFPLIQDMTGLDHWNRAVRNHEQDSEGGGRCVICYRLRLEKTADRAVREGMDAFSTTLTVSPHKKASLIHPIGMDLARRYGVEFLALDFKKKNGFKISCAISREEGLYRQDYCGCLYSRRDAGRKT